MKAGEAMIETLRETETYDDHFPEYQVSAFEESIPCMWPKLVEQGIYCAYLDDFYSTGSDRIKKGVL